MPTETTAPETNETDASGESGGTERAEAESPPPTAAELDEHPAVLFDGVCNLCSGVVSFLIPRDTDGTLRFASLQSPVGQQLLERHDFATEGFDSFVLVEGDRAYTKSSAAIRTAELLGWPYKVGAVARILPKRLRDRAYDIVASNRYDWFGKKDRCMLPDEDVSDRFLE
ncbi:thiol-disulfide oxidoreductase DCC family protein [Halorubrum sp. DTA46]|uniref:thiol-disulfide oxidoreductase DCC family protein n=1 Tax=Halorubrum sp. DTA46 TaxID=3402162 RepID=UPI003AB0FF37